MRKLFQAITAAMLLYSPFAGSTAFMEATSGANRVILYNDPCTLAEVVNLPYRAEWLDGRKTFEGCWSADLDLGVIFAYFSDKTVVLIPMQMFKRVRDA